MKITIEQDTHFEFVDGKITVDQSVTTEVDTEDKEPNEKFIDTSNLDFLTEESHRELTEYWTKEFGGRA
ncbi:MAG: hypothetical protein KH106_02110 [Lactococcus lactis]|nr:hypothetical protein [Lactococcus lactis]